MIKINLVKMMLLVFTCKSATNIVHNKRKHSEVSSESEEHRYEHIKRPYTSILSDVYIGLDISTNADVFELEDFLFEDTRRESALPNAESKEDLFTTFFKELEQLETEDSDTDTDEIQEVCDEFFSITPLDEISNVIISEEESSVAANIQSIILREDPKDMVSHKDALERLKTIYAKFFAKNRISNSSDVLNRCFILFPETITLLYLKIKNNESNEYINSILLKIYNVYKKNAVYCHDTTDEIYTKRINFRKKMLNILRKELPNFNNHVLLYENLSKLEEITYNTQITDKTNKTEYKKRITDMFNILFLLDNEKVLLFLSKMQIILTNINQHHDTHLITTLDLEQLNIGDIFSKITMMKELYDNVLPFIYACSEKRQTFNEYFDCKLQTLQNKQDDFHVPVDIFNVLKGFEIYKETFQHCASTNSSRSFTSFFSKTVNNAAEK